VVALLAADKAPMGDVFERRRARRRTDRQVVPAAEGGSAMSDEQAVFVRGNGHLARLLTDPETAADVASAIEDADGWH